MSYDSLELFAKEVAENIKDFLPVAEETQYDIRVEELLKNNDILLTGLIIKKDNDVISPTIYLDSYYERWQKGDYMSFRSVLQDVARIYQEAVPPVLNVQDIMNFEKVKEIITRQLVNGNSNQALLEHVPYNQYEDLAIIYRIELDSDEHGLSSILLNEKLFEHYGISLQELDAIALENTRRLHPPVIDSLAEMHFSMEKNIIMDTFEVDEKEAREIFSSTYGEANKALVVRNQNFLNGACHILDEKVMDDISEKLGDKFIVIPSSVHDVIALPFDGDFDTYPMYEEMIAEVNETELSETEYLSSSAYLVDAKEHVLLKMNRAEVYLKEQEKKQEEQKEKLQEETNKVASETPIKRHRLP